MMEQQLDTLRQASKFLWELMEFNKPELISQMPHYVDRLQTLVGLLEELLVPGSSFREWVDEAFSPTTLVALEKATDEALHKVMLLLRSAKYLASGRDSLGIPPPELYTKEAARVMGELFELVSLAVAKGTGVVMARRIVRRVLSEAQ